MLMVVMPFPIFMLMFILFARHNQQFTVANASFGNHLLG